MTKLKGKKLLLAIFALVAVVTAFVAVQSSHKEKK